MLPAIPVVPFKALVTLVRNDQLTRLMPFANTYPIMPISRITDILADK